jgi:hypothetical protein
VPRWWPDGVGSLPGQRQTGLSGDVLFRLGRAAAQRAGRRAIAPVGFQKSACVSDLRDQCARPSGHDQASWRCAYYI